jgi:hypothetical protein
VPFVSAAQVEAVRSLYEGRPATSVRLAAATTVHERTIRRHAAAEGWKRQRFAKRKAGGGEASPAVPSQDEDGAEAASAGLPEIGEDVRLEDIRQRLADVLPRQLAQIVTLAERGIVDKGRIDALLSMGRILERSEALGEERAADKQKRSDDELAAMLERIDERIIELAQAYAERLGGSEHPEGTG